MGVHSGAGPAFDGAVVGGIGEAYEGAVADGEPEMTDSFAAFEQSVLGGLTSDGRQIYVVDGGDGSGLTQFLLALRSQLGEGRSQYLDLERVATTPERFLRGVLGQTPFTSVAPQNGHTPSTSRDAFLAALTFLCTATTRDGQPATFLMDEALEVKTFENFPGLRTVASEFVTALAESPNRFVMTTRFSQRSRRLLKGAPERYVPASIRPLTPGEVAHTLNGAGHGDGASSDLAHTVQRLTQGRPAYVRALAGALAASGRADPVAALVAQLSSGGELHARLRYTYEVRLHRARGYGALKAILDVLAEEEPLTLTEISHRLQRTPGSTKDYLSWLEDVDLVSVHRKRYSFRDPLLRLWVQLRCRSNPVSADELAEAVRNFAANAPVPPPPDSVAPPVLGGTATDGRPRSSAIIEID